MLHNDFQITDWTKFIFLFIYFFFFFFAGTENYPSLKYHTNEFVIRLWLYALAITVKYITGMSKWQ